MDRLYSPFVGRDTEMAELKASLEDALSGRGRLVMLVGEPGIGKTRTAQELAALADEIGITVNAVEKWKAGDRYPPTAKTVLEKMNRLAKRKRVPKQRRYSK